ncbi:MAG: hypothetical protein Q4A39_00635 [Eubacteriales bacterium]|nr:hypothetical protein [Eubacteriales bacterium]
MAAINRYRGNYGRVGRIEEAEKVKNSSSPLPPPEMGKSGGTVRSGRSSNDAPNGERSAGGPHGPGNKGPGGRMGGPPRREKPSGPLYDLRGSLDGVLSKLDPGRLETEDLLILAVLYLLYRESGDTELLIALGAFLFL